jgi:SAM-dependent methyltransferase
VHQSAYENMRRCIADFVPTDRRLTVVDFGSGTNPKRFEQGMTHAALFADYDVEMIGIDVAKRLNVDIVLTRPYRVPLKSNSVDVVVSGQTFEHIPFFWASMLEIARLLKPGGIFIMTVPSRGHPHTKVDCWRYYDDGVRALAAFTGLRVRRARTDFPTKKEGPGRIYELISDVDVEGYWGDTVGVLQKPKNYPTRRMALVRGPVVWWANRISKVFVSSGELADRRRRQAKKRSKGQAKRQRRVPDSAA